MNKASAPILAAGLFAGLSLLATPARASKSPLNPSIIHNYGENGTPRSAAMGGALRAMGSGSSAVFLNPAALPEVRLYHIQALAQVTPETGRQVYGGTIVDSVTSRLAGSFSLLGGSWTRAASTNRSLDMRLGLAFPITDKFLIGLGGRYLKVSQSGLGPFGLSQASGGLNRRRRHGRAGQAPAPPGHAQHPHLGRGHRRQAHRLDLHRGRRTEPHLHQERAHAAHRRRRHRLRRRGLLDRGGRNRRPQLVEQADGAAQAQQDLVVASVVPIRAGYRFNQGAKLHTLSLGTGYVGQSFSIEGAVKRTLSSPGETMMVFSIAYHLESSGLTRGSAAEAAAGQ